MKIKVTALLFLSFFEDNSKINADIDTARMDLISLNQLERSMDFQTGKQQPRWYLINVLPKDLCADCCIPGSINIPTHLLQQKLKKWPRERKLIIYCAGDDCPLSKYAVQTLKSMGFTDVSVLDGGMRAWRQKMLPTLGSCKSGYL